MKREKEIETLDFPVQNWNMLNWEQLQSVAQIWIGEGDEFLKRFNVLLTVMGWEMVGCKWQMPWIDKVTTMTDEELMKALEDSSAWKALDEADAFLRGEGDALVAIVDKQGKQMAIEGDNLMGAAMELTKWLDEPQQLMSLPVKCMKVGEHEYKMPGTALVDVEFEQFQEAQKYEERVWMMMRRVKELLGIGDSEGELPNTGGVEDSEGELPNTGNGEGADAPPVEEKELTEEKKEVVELVGEIRKAKAQFLGQMMVRMEWKGWKIVRKEWKVLGLRLPVWTLASEIDCRYRDVDAEVLKDMESAPEWLFAVVEQYLQGCVAFYAGQYKSMFKRGGDKGDKKAPLIARVDMVNTLMKYQGFSCQDVVRRMKVPDAFSIMNAMSKEAEEVEKMKRESERKR